MVSRTERIGAAALFLAAGAVAAAILWGAYCALTWGKFTFLDYGLYTQMVWNCGHGRWFQVLLDRSYLELHLSFTLALLGPLFRVWDHVFLLSLVQWLAAAAGVALLSAAVGRARRSAWAAAGTALLLLAHPYTQSVLLSEFHGIGLYLLLLPWLYVTLATARAWTWLPLALTLGLREDAAFVALPFVVYFAWRDRWRGGWVYAALTLAYGVSAVTWFFPAFSGAPLLERRPGLEPGHLWAKLMVDGKPGALAVGLFWAILPFAPWLFRRTWVPWVAFAAVPLLLAAGSPHPHQFGFKVHYPAPLLAGLFCAMAETCRRDAAANGPSPRRWTWAVALALLLVAHLFRGFLPGGGRSGPTYRVTRTEGREAIAMAAALPRDGLLVTSMQLAGYAANRTDLMVWDFFDATRHQPRWVWFDLSASGGGVRGRAGAWLERSDYGVVDQRGNLVLLERGADPSRNAGLRREL